MGAPVGVAGAGEKSAVGWRGPRVGVDMPLHQEEEETAAGSWLLPGIEGETALGRMRRRAVGPCADSGEV